MENKNEEKYVAIQSWMVSDLKLSGNDLIVYALIYGFNSRNRKFIGTPDYISKFTGCSTRQISRILDNLVEKGLLTKTKFTMNRTNRCEYRCNIDFSAEKKADLKGENDVSNTDSMTSSHYDNMSESHYDNMSNNNINNSYYTSNTSYLHTSYINTRNSCNNIRKPEPSVQSDRDVAKTLKLNNKTKNRVNSVLAYIQKRNVNQRVYSLFIDYLISLVELDREFSFKSMQKQIDALLELTVEQQIKALNETIIKGWRSLKYSVDNIKNMAASPNKNECVKPIAKQQYTEEEKKQILERCKEQPIY